MLMFVNILVVAAVIFGALALASSGAAHGNASPTENSSDQKITD